MLASAWLFLTGRNPQLGIRMNYAWDAMQLKVKVNVGGRKAGRIALVASRVPA